MILIIGATSFIGMYTTEAFLKAGYKVTGTGRNKALGNRLVEMGAEFISLDITKKEQFSSLPDKDVDAVIVLAGLLPAHCSADLVNEENAADYFEVNVIGIINILEYCRAHGIKKVIGNCSYSDVSDAWGKGRVITEEEPRGFKFTGDHAVYVISKNASNDVMEYYNQQHGMQCSWFRFPPVYGVGPHGTIMVNGKAYKSGIATFVDNAIEGKDIEIWGDPKISRDIIYVKDVADAYVKASQSDMTKGLYNMTGGVGVELEEQVKIIIDVFGGAKKSNIVYRTDKKNNTPSYLYSMEKAKRDFGFVPQYTDFRKMMIDYKMELESGRWDILEKRDS